MSKGTKELLRILEEEGSAKTDKSRNEIYKYALEQYPSDGKYPTEKSPVHVQNRITFKIGKLEFKASHLKNSFILLVVSLEVWNGILFWTKMPTKSSCT